MSRPGKSGGSGVSVEPGVVHSRGGLTIAAPDRTSAIRLGAVLGEQHDEWAEGRRYLGLDVLSRSRLTHDNDDHNTHAKEDLTPAALTA